MPSNIQSHIDRLAALRERLFSLAAKLFDKQKQKTSAEYIALVEMWSKVKQVTQELTFLNSSIDTLQSGIEKGDAEAKTEISRQRLQRDIDNADKKVKSAKRIESNALKLIEEQKTPPDPKKEDKTAQQEKPKAIPKDLQTSISDRTKLIDDIISRMEARVNTAQQELLRTVVDDFVGKMEMDEDGNIKNTLANKRKISLLDNVYQKFVQDSGVKIVETIVKGVSDVMNFNGKYYSVFTTKAKLGEIMAETKGTIEDWLGITKKGGLVENGYLKTLLENPEIRNTVRNSVFNSVVSQKGFFEVKKDLSDYIAGNKEKAGALQQYHRNFVYDTFSQVDRTQAKILADKVGLNYAIYEGGIIKTSRKFCRDRNGKVFTKEEIAKFNPTVARPPNYNPFTDLGGYGCRHHLNWVPDAVAFVLRPELRPAPNA